MNRMRRTVTAGLAALPALSLLGRSAAAAEPLKISHQFPGGTATEGDFRDQLCRRFATEVSKKTNGALKFAGLSRLVADEGQLAVRRAASAARSTLSLVPISYSGGEVQEFNIGLMPALIPTYEVAQRWKTAEVGRMFQKIVDDRGRRHRVLDLAGGRRRESRSSPLVAPDDAKGMKVRGGSREMDMVLKEAGASVHLAAVERDLRGDADRRDGGRDDVVDELHLVQARGDREVPDDGARQDVLVHARAADDVEGRVREAAEAAAGRDHADRRRARDVRRGLLQEGRRSLRAESTRRPARRSRTSTRRRARSGRTSRGAPPGRITPSTTRTARS